VKGIEGWREEFVSRSDGVASLVRAFVVPALRKEREERGTQFIGDVGEVKSLGHPPFRCRL
jgi:hypothetical protein